MAKKGGSKNAKPGAQPYQPAGRAGGRGESATAAGRGKSGGRKGSGRGGGRGGRGGKNGGHAQPAAGTETEEELRREIMKLRLEKEEAQLRAKMQESIRIEEEQRRRLGRHRGESAVHLTAPARSDVRSSRQPQPSAPSRAGASEQEKLGRRLAAEREASARPTLQADARQETTTDDERRANIARKLREKQQLEACQLSERRLNAAAQESPEEEYQAEVSRRKHLEENGVRLIKSAIEQKKGGRAGARRSYDGMPAVEEMYESIKMFDAELKEATASGRQADDAGVAIASAVVSAAPPPAFHSVRHFNRNRQMVLLHVDN